jgi:amino acid transporter
MPTKLFDRLLIFSLFFLALWFFGNLYEEILIAPNHIRNAYEKLQHWHGFFTEINQIYYYVPFTQLAVVIAFILYKKSNDNEEKFLLKKASIYGFLGIAITAIIVTQLNLKLYVGIGNNIDQYRDQLQMLSIIWLIGNAIRLYFVGTAILYILKVYVHRQIKITQANNHH